MPIKPKAREFRPGHGKQCKEKPRPSARARGYTRKWEKARAIFLRQNPLCVACMFLHGRPRAATEVDHIIPHRGDYKLFWDRDNWQPLCKPCHSSKTAKERAKC